MKNLTHHHDGLGLTELCKVLVVDEPHPVNGAHYEYWLKRALTEDDVKSLNLQDDARETVGAKRLGAIPWAAGQFLTVGKVQFQRGPRSKLDSIPGTLDGALISILLHRYECFQDGPFASRENALVITKLQEALHWMQHRARERATRGVLGKNER